MARTNQVSVATAKSFARQAHVAISKETWNNIGRSFTVGDYTLFLRGQDGAACWHIVDSVPVTHDPDYWITCRAVRGYLGDTMMRALTLQLTEKPEPMTQDEADFWEQK